MELEPVILFGGYVENASISVGYGSQSSTAQLTLVYDGDGPKNNIDHTKNFPLLGTCIGFVFGELKFAGIFQRWTESKSLDGYKYNIILESPAKILDGVQVILDSFQGTSYPIQFDLTNQIKNIWNVFGALENVWYGGIFGGSNVNSAGMPGIAALEIMEAMSRGESVFGGPAVFGESSFSVDFTQLKSTIASIHNVNMYRIKGPVQSITSIIDEACSLVLHDYIVEIHPKVGEITTGIIIDPVIKIQMVDRSVPPDIGVIRRVIETYEQNEQLVSSDFGMELTSGSTQKIVIGAPATRYVIVKQSGLRQIWGKTKSNLPEYTDKIVLDDGRKYPIDGDPDIMEVRAALHSFDSWVLWHICRRQKQVKNPIIDAYAANLFTSVVINDYTLNRIGTGQATAMDLIDSSLAAAQKRNLVTTGGYVYEELQKIHNAIKSAGEEYWGRKFFASLPVEFGGILNNVKFVTEDFKYINSWEIADSAWHEPPAPYSDVSFRDGDGKLKPTASWTYNPNTYDYTNLGNGYCFDSNGGIGSIVNVDKDIYWNSFNGTTANCVVDLPPVMIFDQYTTEHNALFHFLQLYFGYSNQQLSGIAGFGWEAGSTIYGIAPNRAVPTRVGIPQVSTRYRWGPWYGWSSLKGTAEVVIEESLSPETFGSINGMAAYGLTYAYVANAQITGAESGSVELAGLPIGNVGRRFLVSGPYVTGMDISMSVGGFTTSYKFNTWTPEFGKLAKYNADRISNINKSSLAALQETRSAAQKRPFKPQVYRDKPVKYGRPFALGMGNMGAISAHIKPNPQNPKKPQTKVSGGAVNNQAPPVAQNPAESYVASMEQVYSPVYIAKTPDNADVGNKPTFQKPKDSNYVVGTTEIAPNSTTLNPYFKFEDNDFDHMVSNKGTAPDLNSKKNPEKPTSVQVMGLRGPLMLSGWGRGVDMKPIPFDPDDVTEYHEETGDNRNKWKTGPVDLRWDEERKVWGPGVEIIEGFLVDAMTAATSKTAPTKFKVDIYRNQNKDIETNGLSSTVGDIKWEKLGQVNGINRSTKLTGAAGAYVVLARINYEWRPIYIDC